MKCAAAGMNNALTRRDAIWRRASVIEFPDEL
jgi:hypothetical protein